ncbi:glycoside hydrolase family 57 protein [Candidatus Thiosymbion oneisti]|uniref:glycoside hydrolase family 57 protein n=1 Tax=Candidatus Thiosymbion oneisti TaxID=589554 RepID=UPI00105B8056|nr:1,4-alpha-glucan branching protein domain-containing protein [Candidatus Thiosymbion oneisti]
MAGGRRARVTVPGHHHGHFALLLHAHLPFVRHPEHPRHLEEHWLFEAVTDVYLPLLGLLRAAVARGSRFRLTLSLSPTLLCMLADPLLAGRYLDYLDRLARLAGRLTGDPRSEPGRRSLACFYGERLERLRAFYLDELGGDLIAAFAALEASGLVELMTTAATHGYLPLLRSQPTAVRAQLRVARDHFRATFGHAPEGLWLPECGYYPGLEHAVAQAGYRYLVLDAHGLQQASPPPRHGVYAPCTAGETGKAIAVFGRDPDSAQALWCPTTGYPGHPLYREYHWDPGYEGDSDLLADFLPPGVKAAPTGLKFHRVTGRTDAKAPYEPAAALDQAERDAQRFVAARRRLLGSLSFTARPPIIVAPYDAELFGHWWFEGPAFIDALIRCLDTARDMQPVTLGEHLHRHGTAGEIRPATSSWGEQGYNGAWLRPDMGWVYLQLHQAAGELAALVNGRQQMPDRDGASRLLRQAARSLLLAQSSDWTFHLGRGAGSDYCESRLRDQLARFRFLAGALRGGRIRDEQLAALERMDNLFPDLDLRHFGCTSQGG